MFCQSKLIQHLYRKPQKSTKKKKDSRLVSKFSKLAGQSVMSWIQRLTERKKSTYQYRQKSE